MPRVVFDFEFDGEYADNQPSGDTAEFDRSSETTTQGANMCDQAKGVCLGDLMTIYGGQMAASAQVGTDQLRTQLAILNTGATKSLFEVDANETGLTNAQSARARGGATTDGAGN